MIDLEKGMFKPLYIAVSILFLPSNIALLIILFIDLAKGKLDMEFLIVTISLILAYIIISVILFKISHKKNRLMKPKIKWFEIYTYKSGKLEDTRIIEYKEIEYMIYYRMNSVKNWICSFFGGPIPKTARIVYKNLVYWNNMKVEEDLGYMELEDIKKIAKERRIKLIIE